MYSRILFCLDNSDYANAGVDIGLKIAAGIEAQATGCHVYAAMLHNDRFRHMEGTLPPQYRKEDELKRQRDIHDSLITKGLKIISDSYTAVFEEKARLSGVEPRCVSREGKNFEEIVKETEEGGYDLVVMGAFGLGKTPGSRIGSVAERVARRIKADILIVRDTLFSGKITGDIVSAIDGSPKSYGGLMTAIGLSKIFGTRVEAVSAFDPYFHQTAFRSLSGVLSEEAGKVFRFREQEKLHEEIIDKGLAKIYESHLKSAESLGADAGVKVKTRLLSGKAPNEILDHIENTSPFLLVVGKTGAHASPTLDIGSATENCLREAPCNILISSREFTPTAEKKDTGGPSWSEEAKDILKSIPPFARGIVKNMAEEAAVKEGISEITPSFMRTVRKKMES